MNQLQTTLSQFRRLKSRNATVEKFLPDPLDKP
jgi:hypothetical protein